ncbi:hypothetical protein KAR91_29370 [Candidatus Pacearchaeota archaeon]|nr:hypothetical protein [Candidatus Pacearchaeota archaeon]
MEKIVQTIGLDSVIQFIENLINIFVVKDISSELQQATKIVILLILFLLISILARVLIKFITGIVEPAIHGMKSQVEYIFYSFVTFLIFAFIKNISFSGACTVLIFMLIISQIHPLTKTCLGYYEKKASMGISDQKKADDS